jgi:hypothetical protein
MSILDEHLDVLIEPRASDRGALEPARAVTLAGRLDPDEAVDVLVARVGSLLLADAGRRDVAPLAPFLAGTR